ncbi:MAG: hypothetical protein GY768_08535, partial [Planctomycetaceae bacterium]|nr:hypothetical protein [Planctomycetaceae bacterium]
SIFSLPTPGILSNDTDAENDSLNAILNTDVSNGTLTLNSDGSFSYEPDNGFSGTDSFTYLARDDGNLDSNEVTVTLNVAGTGGVLFEDSFEESEWNGKWVEDLQNDWFRSTANATDGSFAAEVDGRANQATLTIAESLDITGMSSVLLTFDWFIERGFDRREFLALDLSTDGGTTWTQDRQLSGGPGRSVDEGFWHNESIDLVVAGYESTDLKIRFRCQASSIYEDANVDNVRIEAITVATPLAAIALPSPEQTIATTTLLTPTHHDNHHMPTDKSASKLSSLVGATQFLSARSQTETTTVDAIFAKWNEQISTVKIGQPPEFQLDGLLEKLTF